MARGTWRCCTRVAGRAICSELSRSKPTIPKAHQQRRLRAEKPSYTENDTMFRSVRARLTFWYAGVLTSTLLLLSLVIYFIVKRSVTERTDAGLIELADSFLATLDAELSDSTPALDVAAAARQSI